MAQPIKIESMNIKIEIECETISDFYNHLTELRRQIKKRTKQRGLNPIRDQFTNKVGPELYDDNCYGTHTVKINASK